MSEDRDSLRVRPSATVEGRATLAHAAAGAGIADVAQLLAARDLFTADPLWACAVLDLDPHAPGREIASAAALVLLAAAELDRDLLTARRRTRRAAALSAADVAAATVRGDEDRWRQVWQEMLGDLPVPVFVAHDWSHPGNGPGRPGADHVVVLADLEGVSLARAAGTALCENGSKARMLAHLDRDPAAGIDRVPDCARCVRLAQKMTGRPATGTLT